MNLLFVHQAFPGQYLHLVRALAASGQHRIVALSLQPPSTALPQTVELVRYRLERGNSPQIHPWALDFESKLIRAEAAATAAHQLDQQGFRPDLICGHPGWGELLLLNEIWPQAPILAYQEFFYQARGFDFDFDPEFQADRHWRDAAGIQMKTVNPLLNLSISRWNITPTAFQRSSFPAAWQPRISVLHDGIDTVAAAPKAEPAPLTLPDHTVLQAGAPIVTFVNRSLEPYRGCHSFIRAIPALQRLVPEARLVIVGSRTGVSYGSPCPQGEWADHFLAEIKGDYDPSRVHFTGVLPYGQFLPLLQLSAAHVYLTYPFVLSWSLLEAMACGCAVVGSATAPVQEVITDGHNGLLVDFFSPGDLATAVAELLQNRPRARALGAAARTTILQRYSLERCLPRQLALMDLVASGVLGRRED